MIDENKLLSEISSIKKNEKSENGDYLSGYFSALSTIEGIISGYEKTENFIRNKAIDEFAERLRLDCLDSCFHETHMFHILKVAEELKK